MNDINYLKSEIANLKEELHNKKNELETVASAYNDLKREHSITKQSLETHKEWLSLSDENVVRLVKELDALKEQNSNKGIKLFKKYNEFVRNHKNKSNK